MTIGTINIEITSLFINITLDKVLEESESLVRIDLGDKIGGKLKTASVDNVFKSY